MEFEFEYEDPSDGGGDTYETTPYDESSDTSYDDDTSVSDPEASGETESSY